MIKVSSLALMIVLQAPALLACSLGKYQRDYVSHEAQTKEDSKSADAIFVGKVIEQKTIPVKYWDRATNYFKYYHLIQVSTVYKGKVSRYLEYVRPTSSHWIFDKDTEYLFFDHYNNEKELIFGSYAGTQELNMAIASSTFKYLNTPITKHKKDLIIQ